MLTKQDFDTSNALRRLWRKSSQSAFGTLALALFVVIATGIAWNVLTERYGTDTAFAVLGTAYAFYAILYVSPLGSWLMRVFYRP